MIMRAALYMPQAGASYSHHRAGALPGKPLSADLRSRHSASYSHAKYCRTGPLHSSRVTTGTPFLDPENSPDAALASEPVTAAGSEPTAEPGQPPSLQDRVIRFFRGESMDRKRLAALGLGAVASYGMVSNVTYGAGLAVSWITFVKQKGLSPLQPGQWPVFLAFYAGFWTVQNFVRPLRFALAVTMAPFFERFMDSLPMSRKKAFGVYLVLLGTITTTCIFGSIAVFGGSHAFSRAALRV